MPPRTCVTPDGRFSVGIHDPGFEVANLRENTIISRLGKLPDGQPVENNINFPPSTVRARKTDRIYEIANAFPFRGSTFINSAWANRRAGQSEAVCLPPQPDCSFTGNIEKWKTTAGEGETIVPPVLDLLPRPILLALAQASTDPKELATLAAKSCTLLFENKDAPPTGIAFKETEPGKQMPQIHDHDLYDILGNNPFLPDAYKQVMVLSPGIQGNSEIIGEATSGTHVFEYLRQNSYIPWGHFASNMANDEIRYRAHDLTPADMTGIRHLYYQRIYVRLAEQLNIALPHRNRPYTPDELEKLRLAICSALNGKNENLFFNSTLWGWNFGFEWFNSKFRIHIHVSRFCPVTCSIRAYCSFICQI